MGLTRKVLNWYARMAPSHGKISPPYEHVVQIGDPVLRKVAEPVPLDKINSEEIQNVIKKLHYVLNKYGSVGMSAPQIGISKRIFVMKHSARHIAMVPQELVRSKGMKIVPFSVFINPTLKVVDFAKIIYVEGCESVQGYVAEVPRYREVQVTGYNAEAEQTTVNFKDWPARVAQHEMQHLEGVIFTDIMDRKTLECTCWQDVNLAKGKVEIPFYRN